MSAGGMEQLALADVQQAVAMLQALRDPTRHDHHAALSALDSQVTNPQFIAATMHVFANTAQYAAALGLTADIRQLAGLVIKNYVFPHLGGLNPHVQNSLKNEVRAVTFVPLTLPEHYFIHFCLVCSLWCLKVYICVSICHFILR